MKKILSLLSLLLFGIVFSNGVVRATPVNKIKIDFYRADSFELTNAEGKKLVYKDRKISGNMRIYENEKFGLKGRRITVDMSSKFIYQSKKELSYIRLCNEKWFSSIEAKSATAVSVVYTKDSSDIYVSGNNMWVDICTNSVLTMDSFIAVTGTGTNVELKNSKRGIEMTNLTGVCDFESDDLQFKKNSETRLRFLPISNKVRIKNPMSKKLKITGAIPYNSKVAKKVENFRVIPVSRTSQALSFNRVKKAKGYAVYRKVGDGKAELAADLKGNASTVWIDKDIPAGQERTYYVRSYKEKNRKKIYAKRSYLVSAVVFSDTLSNATKVTLNKSGKRKLKKGKTLKLKAKITGEKGKKLVSKDVRWCSLNKKVAVVDKKGRVKALKKGTCKIHAKAHNGKNSETIIIKVV